MKIRIRKTVKNGFLAIDDVEKYKMVHRFCCVLISDICQLVFHLLLTCESHSLQSRFISL